MPSRVKTRWERGSKGPPLGTALRAGICDWQRSELYRKAFALPHSPRLLFNTVSNFDHIIVKIRRKYRNKEATKMVGRKKKMVLTNKVSNNSVVLF